MPAIMEDPNALFDTIEDTIESFRKLEYQHFVVADMMSWERQHSDFG